MDLRSYALFLLLTLFSSCETAQAFSDPSISAPNGQNVIPWNNSLSQPLSVEMDNFGSFPPFTVQLIGFPSEALVYTIGNVFFLR